MSAAMPIRPTVLVVDDTPDTLGFLTDALEGAGYTALVATGGPQALALVGRLMPDLILLDAMMPVMDGFETCRRLKTGLAAAVPVIFMTALSDTEHIVRGLGAGGVDYLTKPIVLDELFARVRVHLANARAARGALAALDATGSALVAVDSGGTVLWSTPQARALLPDDLTAALPAAALADAALTPDGVATLPSSEAGPLSARIVGRIGANEMLFRLERPDTRRHDEILAARFALTAREAEVLLWIARGKPNRDIAEILSLSPRTVNKHLETIFAKLGVENRASAAVLAARALDER
ncbi:response regulator transcription factor [Lichenihabitans sp. Uapishka_5]|uniref:response regulator transcription factor n=1 Tax=Lichenihabitans sp. Uapishka_5 TaxID=3037302 RepID=UPI0029E81C0C|nr:response regulator transcription factor [Lichenihabitans sp. Uapishka_5]MDX7952218.1 response regulator transcription factor [Lichenihabitans sp. Uapishka_5]